jgi:urease accessory protein
VRAAARIEVAHRNGRDEVVDRSCAAPISVRRCGDRVLLASSAAAPVGGDELVLEVVVGADARADVGSVSAGLVWPGATNAWSSTITSSDVGARADLAMWLEPTVSVVGSLHRATTTHRLAADATCRIVEEVALGRCGEPSGRLDLRLRVERAGVVVVDHEDRFGPDVAGAGSSVSVGGGRHVLSAVVVGPPAGESRTCVESGRAAAWLPVAPDAAIVFAVGADRPGVLELVDRLAPELRHDRCAMVRPSDQAVDQRT